MADFKTHITLSTGLGIAYGSIGYWQYDLPMGTCVIAGGLCSLAGMLPDLDSDSGIPVRETKLFTSAVVPMLMMERFERMGMSHASMVFAGGALYFFIRFFVWSMFKRYTRHRGMWHSIPAACTTAVLAFLLCSSPDITIRLFQAWAVLLGFMSHLLLDEIYSVDINGRRLKKSFGTAMKFWGRNRWANFSTYGKLIAVAWLAINDPILQNSIESDDLPLPAYAQSTIRALQWDAIRQWLPHDRTTHEEFNQQHPLPVRRAGHSRERRRGSRHAEPGQFVQWLNYWTGTTHQPAGPSAAPSADPDPQRQPETGAWPPSVADHPQTAAGDGLRR